MAGALRNAMVWMGLAEDDRDEVEQPTQVRQRVDAPREPGGSGSRSVAHPVTATDRRAEHSGQVTPIRKQVAQMVPSTSGGGELHRITTIHPRTYNEAKTIGESFREGIPVIMNLTDMTDSDAKRLVDFSAGLVFGLHGAIEKVTNKVFLLSPASVEVATQEEERPVQRTFFNQS